MKKDAKRDLRLLRLVARRFWADSHQGFAEWLDRKIEKLRKAQ